MLYAYLYIFKYQQRLQNDIANEGFFPPQHLVSVQPCHGLVRKNPCKAYTVFSSVIINSN